jgi:hypothetical protein
MPEPPKEYNLNSEMEEEDTEKSGPHKEEPTDPDFQGPASESPHKLIQNELNDLAVRLGIRVIIALKWTQMR